MSKIGNFLGSIVRDANRIAVQTSSEFVTLDASVSPNSSPLAYTTSATITLAVPLRAHELILTPSTNLRISEDSTMASYDVISAYSKEGISCARMSSIYIKGDTVAGSVKFRFSLI